MLKPEEAYRRLRASGPFDDPTVSWCPHRWYFDADGVLCCQPWRCIPTRYPEFHRPKPDQVATSKGGDRC